MAHLLNSRRNRRSNKLGMAIGCGGKSARSGHKWGGITVQQALRTHLTARQVVVRPLELLQLDDVRSGGVALLLRSPPHKLRDDKGGGHARAGARADGEERLP